jgi:hypothetical protein
MNKVISTAEHPPFKGKAKKSRRAQEGYKDFVLNYLS